MPANPLLESPAPPLTRLAREDERPAWDEFVRSSGGVLMQSWGWGVLRSRYGWKPARWLAQDPRSGAWLGALQVLRRPLGPGGLGWAYAPRGPVLGSLDQAAAAGALLRAAAGFLRLRGVVALRLDPEWSSSEPAADSLRRRLHLGAARFDIQHRDSWVVDLGADEQSTLSSLPPSTRRNIRIAGRAEVTVTAASSRSALAAFYRLHLETVRRQGFTTRPQSYYEAAVKDLDGVVFLASHRGAPLASAIAISCGPRLIYLYGGTSMLAPEVRASYALHWEVIRWGIRQGCSLYDMWGVPRHFDPTNRAHGYATFKTRWGGRPVSHSGLLLAPLWGPADPVLHRLEARLLRRRPLLT